MNAAKTGALIAQMRKEKGLTQRELAERVYVSVQAVSKWELGKNFPDLSLMEPLSDILDLTVSELLAGERGEAPKDELVRDTLRLGEEQLRPKIKRWRGLFIAAAIVLAAVLAALGYAWLRDNTQLLPQQETVFTPIELEEEQNALVDLLTLPNNWDFLRMYRVALADGMDQVVFKAELWSQRHDVGPERELVDSWHLWTGYPRAGQKTEPRHHLLAFRLTFLEDGSLQYKIKLGGSTMMTTKALLEELPAPITGMSWSATAVEPVTVDRENGAVLLELGMTLESEPKSYFFLVKAYWE